MRRYGSDSKKKNSTGVYDKSKYKTWTRGRDDHMGGMSSSCFILGGLTGGGNKGWILKQGFGEKKLDWGKQE